MWHDLHLHWENTRIQCGKSYTCLKKTEGFCVVKATPPLGEHQNSKWRKQRLAQESTRNLRGKSYKIAVFNAFGCNCVAKATKMPCLMRFPTVYCVLHSFAAVYYGLLRFVTVSCVLMRFASVCCGLLRFAAFCCGLLRFAAVCCVLLRFIAF